MARVRLDELQPDDIIVSPVGHEGRWIVAHICVEGSDGDIEVDLFKADDTDFLNLHADVSDQVERVEKDSATPS